MSVDKVLCAMAKPSEGIAKTPYDFWLFAFR